MIIDEGPEEPHLSENNTVNTELLEAQLPTENPIFYGHSAPGCPECQRSHSSRTRMPGSFQMAPTFHHLMW